MKPVEPPGGANLTLTGEGCNDLRGVIHNNPDFIETHWELTDAELWHVITNRRIILITAGHNFPPVSLRTLPT